MLRPLLSFVFLLHFRAIADSVVKNATAVDLSNFPFRILPENYFRDSNWDGIQIRIKNSDLEKIDRDAFDGLDHLNYLELSNDKITELDPETFSRLKALEKLNLNSNRLKTISLIVPALQEIILSDNAIEYLEDDFLVGKNIRVIHLQNNKLDKLNCSFKNLEQLETIDISGNNIIDIYPRVFANNSKIARFYAIGNSLDSTDGFKLASLIDLDLSWNAFEYVNSDTFSGMALLEYLNVSHNNIKTMNEPFKYLTSLQKIDLSDNEIDRIEPDLFQYNYRLSYLKLENNQIKTLAPFTAELNSLELFDISHNQISTIDIHFFKNTTRINQLDLSHNRLTSVSELFRSLLKLIKIDLSNNSLTSIKDCFSYNENLRSVNLSYNALDSSFDDFKNNVHLNRVDLSHNQIFDLCRSDFKFEELFEIDLSHNKITDVTCFRNNSKYPHSESLTAVDVKTNPLVCNSDFDDTVHWFAVRRIFPEVDHDVSDDVTGYQRKIASAAESFRLWNSVKRGLCSDGLDINTELPGEFADEIVFEKSSESEESDSRENANEFVPVQVPAVENDETHVNDDNDDNNDNFEATYPPKIDLMIPEEDEDAAEDIIQLPIANHNAVNTLNIQSQKRYWENLAEGDDMEWEIKRDSHGFTWYTIALILTAISLTFVFLNIAVFMYVRFKSYKLRSGLNSNDQSYTQLCNDVYRDTTEPLNVTSPNTRMNKIFSSDQINEVLLNFGLWKQSKEDSDSVKKMIVKATSNSEMPQC